MSEEKFRVSQLLSSDIKVVTTSPDKSLEEATTLMMMEDFSQLPVMTSERSIKGVISWRSIGTKLRLGNSAEKVSQCMDSNFGVFKDNTNLLEVVKEINKREFVLITNNAGKLSGIITLADIGEQFLSHSEPFIELEQIEMIIRFIIKKYLSVKDLVLRSKSQAPERRPAGSSDLMFGDYVNLFEDKAKWEKVGLNVDRKTFVKKLKTINNIRNRLMHFRPGGISEKDRIDLNKTSRFLRKVRRLHDK